MSSDRQLPRVVTSCSGRFHMFDQARELASLGLLHRLITDYPPTYPVRYGVPRKSVQPMWAQAYVMHGWRRVGKRMPAPLQQRVNRLLHDYFSRTLARALPGDFDFFIGLSSFCLEALIACKERGIACAVDHGSLHQEDDARLILEDAKRWNIAPPKDTSPPWLIEKENREFQTADHVFVLSTVARDSLVRNGVAANRIFVNPCGVDLSAFGPRAPTDDVFRVIQIGTVSLRKGTLDLLAAFAQANIPGAELLFVGGGRETSGLEATLEKLMVPGVYFRPPVPQVRLREYYNQASVFVLASLADGFGMVVAQAMACGLPVIVTENVGARDLVEDGVNGFVVPASAPAQIAEKLRVLYANPELARQMGEAARARVEHRFGWSEYGKRLGAFICQLCPI